MIVIETNIIKDITKLVDDNRYSLEFKIDDSHFIVYLNCDPDFDLDKDLKIPIEYDTLYESVCIPHDDYIGLFNPNEGGIEPQEIKMINSIMYYLVENKSAVARLCKSCRPE